MQFRNSVFDSILTKYIQNIYFGDIYNFKDCLQTTPNMGGSGIRIFIYFCEFNLKMCLMKLKTLEWELNDDVILQTLSFVWAKDLSELWFIVDVLSYI